MGFARLLTPICFLAISLHRSAEAEETPIIAAKRLCDMCHVFVEDLQDIWGSRMKENGDVPLDSAAGHELVEQFCKTRSVQKFKGPDKKVHASNCEQLTQEYTEDIVNEFLALEGRVSKLGSLPILQDEICGQHLAELCPIDDIMADTHSDAEVKCRACIALVGDMAFEVRRNPAWLRLMQKPEKVLARHVPTSKA
ncbi:hypothetical protein CYMTET_27070 [Cymbomonas tetramitiformis]|uniref:Saposin B-type domain-containing protein n=1 Tax=Cymbomonas tetramitiformis TaxID=36881 RepID=A0AAE0FS13_9CHLO|nr:hypothetical protein CYMTET_27070 [Cymbomonas tetramitiformis]